MEKSKSKYLKVSFIGLFVTLCLFIFPFLMAQKSNAFTYLDGSNIESVYCLAASPVDMLDWVTGQHMEDLYPNQYYAYVFLNAGSVYNCALDYMICDSALDFYIENYNVSISSVNDVLTCINSLFYFSGELESYVSYYAQHYYDSYNSSSCGYTEQEYQDYGNLKYQEGYTEGENQGKITGVAEYKNSQEYRDALAQAERDGYTIADTSNRQDIQSIFGEFYPWYVYEPMSNISEDVRYNLKELVDESNAGIWNQATDSLAAQLNESSISFDNSYRFQYLEFDGSSEDRFNYLAYENIVSLGNSLRRDIYQVGIEEGRTDGLEMSDTMMKTFKQIFSAPTYVLGGIFNFEFLGVNIYHLLTFLMSTFLLIFILKKVLGL